MIGLLALAEKEEVVPVVAEDGGMEREVTCPFEWQQFGSRCFKFFNRPAPWIDAEVEPDTSLHKMDVPIVC